MGQPNFESPIYYNNILRKNERQSDTSSTTLIDINQITFLNCTHKYCVCFIDIIDSTKNTNDMMRSDMIQGYYSIFLNLNLVASDANFFSSDHRIRCQIFDLLI